MPAPKNARQSDRGGRTYTWPPTGENFTSTTTLLNALSKPALVYWSARSVAEGVLAREDEWRAIRDEQGDEATVRWLKSLPWAARDKAADAGSAVHAALEALVKGQTVKPWPKALRGHQEQFNRFLDAYQPEWITSEATIFSRSHGYAGTLDWIARIGAHGVVLGDVKTGERVWPEVAPQLASYRYGDWIDLGDGLEHPIPQVDTCAVLHLRPQSFQLIEIQADEAIFKVFLDIARAWKFQNVTSATVIGEQLTPVNLVPTVLDAAALPAPSLDELLAGVT